MSIRTFSPATFSAVLNYLFYKNSPSNKPGYNESYDQYRFISNQWKENNVYDMQRQQFFKSYHKDNLDLSVYNDFPYILATLKNKSQIETSLNKQIQNKYAFTISSTGFYDDPLLRNSKDGISIIFFSYNADTPYVDLFNNQRDLILSHEEISTISNIYNKIFNIDNVSSQTLVVDKYDYRDIISGLLHNGFNFIFNIEQPNQLYNDIYSAYTKQLEERVSYFHELEDDTSHVSLDGNTFYQPFICMCRNCVARRKQIKDEEESKKLVIIEKRTKHAQTI